MNVVYWTNIPAPYMVERFNALARRGNCTFQAWFSARTEPDRSWIVDETQWEFPYRYLPGISFRKHHVCLPVPLLRGFRPDLIIGLHIDPAFLLSQAPLRHSGVRTAFWLAPTSDAWMRRRRWREAIKRIAYPRVDAVITTGSDGKDFAIRYGTSPRRVFTLPHFTDFDHFSRATAAARARRDQIRRRLKISGIVFLYVGHLSVAKGVDYLLAAFADLHRRRGEDVGLLLVGNGRDEERFRQWCRSEGLRNVVFAGFRDRSELPEIYAAADAFIFPTLGDTFGHVVGEAMSSALPVVSTSAASEIYDRIEDGRSGFIVPPADSASLRERMELLVVESALRKALGTAAAQQVAGQTGDHWAEEFEAIATRILALPRQRRAGE
jgi:glycosyltransferase involved in cell wall biosynthesis